MDLKSEKASMPVRYPKVTSEPTFVLGMKLHLSWKAMNGEKMKTDIELSNYTEEELLKELAKRTKESSETSLIVAIGGEENGVAFTEHLSKANSSEDMPNLFVWQLKSRYNPHRNYRLFFFRTNEFDKLYENLKKDNLEFSNWLRTTPSIKSNSL